MNVDPSPETQKPLSIVTSIPPNALSVRRWGPLQEEDVVLSLKSLRSNGFKVTSVNRPSEIEALAGSFPDVRFVGANCAEGLFAGRYGPSLRDILDVCETAGFSGIVNADIYMIGSSIAELAKSDADRFYVARRVDVEGGGGELAGVYRRGIDFFLFDSARFSELLDDDELAQFQIGAPFWDIIMPILASFHGEVSFIEPPFILHPIHAANWSDEDYRRLRRAAVMAVVGHARRHATRRPRAAHFLQMIEKHVGDARRLDTRGRVRKAAAVMNAWLLGIEGRHGQRIKVDLADPIFLQSLRSSFAKVDLGESIPPSPPKRNDPVSVGLRRIRQWQSHKRFQRLMDDFDL